MRYVRTKDEVKAIESTLNSEDLYVFLQRFGNYRGKVMKVADTVEELCDVIVCNKRLFYPSLSYDGKTHFCWYEIKNFRTSITMDEKEYKRIKETSNDFEPYFWKVYGAIWTDKGLIYKAKMKGILPNGEIDWELL